MNETSTNLVDSYTCVVGSMHLIGALIFFPHGELIQLTDDVVGGAGISVPVGVDAVRSCGGGHIALISVLVGVETLEATQHGVAFFPAELVGGTVGVVLLMTTSEVVAVVAVVAVPAAAATTASTSSTATKPATASTSGGVC